MKKTPETIEKAAEPVAEKAAETVVEQASKPVTEKAAETAAKPKAAKAKKPVSYTQLRDRNLQPLLRPVNGQGPMSVSLRLIELAGREHRLKQAGRLLDTAHLLLPIPIQDLGCLLYTSPALSSPQTHGLHFCRCSEKYMGKRCV